MKNNKEHNKENKIIENIDEENNKKEKLIIDRKYKIEKVDEKYLGDEITIKIILIGNSGVGKSSLALRLKHNLFEDITKSTIGFDIFKYVVKINDIFFKLQIWDTCGLEEFSSCTTSLYKNASLAIIVYAIDDRKSFNNIENWKNLVKKNAMPGTLIFIVGNKKDLEKENQRKIKKEEGEKLKITNDVNFFIEASAKENEFIDELFQQIAIKIYEQYLENQNDNENKGRVDFSKEKDSVRIKRRKNTKKKNKKIKGG